MNAVPDLYAARSMRDTLNTESTSVHLELQGVSGENELDHWRPRPARQAGWFDS
jgi:hypothetical protein